MYRERAMPALAPRDPFGAQCKALVPQPISVATAVAKQTHSGKTDQC